MTFRKYLESLNKLAKERPETLGFVVVCASDDEGNGFRLVHYEPQVGNYDEEDEHFEEERELNAICIN